MNKKLIDDVKPYLDMVAKKIEDIDNKQSKIIDTLNDSSKSDNIDPAFLGIPNINFSCVTDADSFYGCQDNHIDKSKMYSKQRIERGFDDSETFDLGMVIMQFILPRLELYIKLANGRIVISDDLNEIYNKCVYHIKQIMKFENGFDYETEEYEISMNYLKSNIGVLLETSW